MTEEKNSWFDDPEWEKLRNEIRKRPALGKSKKSKSASDHSDHPREPKKVKLTIDLSLPNIKMPKAAKLPVVQRSIAKIRAVKTAPKKLVVAGGISCLVLVGAIGINKMLQAKDPADGPRSEEVLSQTVKEPDFETVLPEGSKDQTTGGKVGYDEQKKVVSFRDVIGVVEITVSQQPLPEKFKEDPEAELTKLAQSFSANEVVVASNPKAYLGTSVKGPQTVIFYKNDLLIFIQSSSNIDKNDWTDYIRSLR